MGFSKKKTYGVTLSNVETPTEIQKVVEETIDENGNVKKMVVLKEVLLSDIIKSLPDADIYTLENLMASGVDLQTLPVAHLLDKTEAVDIDNQRSVISQDLYFKLLDMDAEAKAAEVTEEVKTENKK